jgi:quercetin dioxygenase-like cupin family protein
MEVSKSRRQLGADALAVWMAALAASSMPAALSAQTNQTPGSSRRREVIKQNLPGEPEREITLIEVTYPPGAGSLPHAHPNGVMAFVVSGSIASKVGDAPEQTFHAGQAWWEPPGAVHRISRNASNTEPATLLAIYIAPRGASADALLKTL